MKRIFFAAGWVGLGQVNLSRTLLVSFFLLLLLLFVIFHKFWARSGSRYCR